MSTKNKGSKQPVTAMATALNAAGVSGATTAMPTDLSVALAPLPPSAVALEVADGLTMTKLGEKAITAPGLARFPMTQTKSGTLTGHVPNIGAYTFAKLGKAFSEAHATALVEASVEAGSPIAKPAVVTDVEKKQMSAEITALKKQFNAAAKPIATQLINRQDCVVSALPIRQSKNGDIRFTVSAVISTKKASVEEQLRAENAALRKQLLDAGKVLSPAKVKAAKRSGDVIDIAPAAAPVAAPQS